MRVLITGGAGFIGSAIARQLLEKDHAVIIVDDLSTGFHTNVPRDTLFLKLDLADPKSLRALPSDPVDAICHLAAQSSGARSEENPYRSFQVNVISTLLLSQWCLERGVKRFLFASSMTVYGNLRSNGKPITEDAPCAPMSHYGLSKLASEQILQFASRRGLSCTSLRMFSVYGPGQNLQNLSQGMVSIYLAYLLRGMPVPVTGSLDRIRDFVYIDDVVRAWEHALAHPTTASPVYNIGSGTPATVRNLLDALLSVLELPRDYPIVEGVSSPGDQHAIVADVGRSWKELGWQPYVDLTTGLQKMIAWAKAQVQARV